MQLCVTVRSCQKNLKLLFLLPTCSPNPSVAAVDLFCLRKEKHQRLFLYQTRESHFPKLTLR